MKTITLTAAILVMARAAFGDVPERVEQALCNWAGAAGPDAAVLMLWQAGAPRRGVAVGLEAVAAFDGSAEWDRLFELDAAIAGAMFQ